MRLELWHRQLIRSLFHYDRARMDIEKAFMVKFPHVPPFLYKYRSFISSHKQALERGELWTASAAKLNDPHECEVFFDPGRFYVEDLSCNEFQKLINELMADESKAHKHFEKPLKNPIITREYYKKIFERVFADNPTDYDTKIVQALQKVETSLHRKMMLEMSKDMRAGFGVLSLSETPISTLMWSHYSNSHEGFVIEYNFEELPYEDLRKRLCFPVFYSRKQRDATRYMARKRPESLNSLFGQYLALMKDAGWSYEREWRIVTAIGPLHATAPMKMPPPSSVILGLRTSDTDATWMQDFCSLRGIALRRVSSIGRDNELNIEDVKI